MADIVTEIRNDHQEIRMLFDRWEGLDTEGRLALFQQIVEELARHETTEEMIVYPTLRREVDQGDRVADQRIAEEQHAEEMLAQMEDMDPLTDEFAEKFRMLRSEVLEHAEHEEQTVLPELREALESQELQKLGERWRQAKKMAPTHPHPHAPNTPPWNMAAGAVAAVFDRARDRMREMSR